MLRAFTETLAWAERACVIGTDCPELHSGSVERAFAALDTHDLVLGPARDGGYYLIALREVQPELFDRVPWSSDRVFQVTAARADELGLAIHILPTLADVDTLSDVPEELLFLVDRESENSRSS